MSIHPDKVIAHYTEAYQKLYNRNPRDLEIIDNEWIIVNGARMRVAELEYLTKQLQLEYNQSKIEKRNILNRLITWFKG